MSKKKQKNQQEQPRAPQVKLSQNSGISSMTNWLLLLIIIIPFVYSTKTLDPTITPRYLFMGSILLLMAGYFLLVKKTAIYTNYHGLIKAVFFCGFLFAIWSVISMFSAVNFNEGYYEVSRHLLFLILMFAVMTSIIEEENGVLKLFKALVIVSIIQSIVGIAQFYEIGFENIPGANAKPYGMMANRNLFGSAQAFMLPFIIYTFYKSEKLWRGICILAFLVVVISLVLSQTRSAWIASAALLFGSTLLVLIFSAENRKKWLTAAAAGLAIIAVSVFLIIKSDSEGSLTSSISERTASLVQTKNQSNESVTNATERFKIWNNTRRLIKDHPVTGVGPGNWKIRILDYGTDNLIWANGKTAPDRPHNVYLLLASETGIPGVLFYSAMWLLIIFIAFKVILKPKNEDQRVLMILMLAGLTAFAADSMFSFPTERVEHSLYIYLMGGIILANYFINTKGDGEIKKSVNNVFSGMALAVLIFNIYLGYLKYNYEVHLNLATAYQNINNYNQMIEEAEAGKSTLITMGPETGIIMELKTAIALKELKQYDEALKELNIAKKYNPNSANMWSTMGTVYTELKLYDTAITCYKKAMALTPKYDVVLKNLSVNYFLINNYDACIETLKKLDIKDDTQLTALMQEAERRKNEPK